MRVSRALPSRLCGARPATVLVAAGLSVGIAIGWMSPGSAKEVFVSVGTGELNGNYYPVGTALCKVADPDLRTQGIRCSPEATPGSVYNIGAVQSGELEFGIVQSDVQFAATKGVDAWNNRPVPELRSVLSLYPELVTVIARANANIHVVADLMGKRINIGNLGAGTRITWDAIAMELGRSGGKPGNLTDLNAGEAATALCSGVIDADLLILGHPSRLVASQLAACPSNFVAITGPVIDNLIDTHMFYVRSSIPTELYGITAEVPTFGTLATLVTSASTDGRVVAAMARTIITHVAELRRLHPALAELRADQMITQGLTAPLHPAAEAVYRELGLLK